ncbi:hypothetical protein SUGI_0796260 [Cryptomeria japonica]|nr:hypothetical protein SUGI_0796260 [Cryptomeria japonica]
MAERRSINATLILVLVLMSLLHYSAAQEEEARCRYSYKMENSKGNKSFEIGNRQAFSRKAFNPLVTAISGFYAGVALFWVAFAYLALKYIKIFSDSIDEFGEYDIMSRPRIRSRNHIESVGTCLTATTTNRFSMYL